jgi:hypothetical protein
LSCASRSRTRTSYSRDRLAAAHRHAFARDDLAQLAGDLHLHDRLLDRLQRAGERHAAVDRHRGDGRDVAGGELDRLLGGRRRGRLDGRGRGLRRRRLLPPPPSAAGRERGDDERPDDGAPHRGSGRSAARISST